MNNLNNQTRLNRHLLDSILRLAITDTKFLTQIAGQVDPIILPDRMTARVMQICADYKDGYRLLGGKGEPCGTEHFRSPPKSWNDQHYKIEEGAVTYKGRRDMWIASRRTPAEIRKHCLACTEEEARKTYADILAGREPGADDDIRKYCTRVESEHETFHGVEVGAVEEVKPRWFKRPDGRDNKYIYSVDVCKVLVINNYVKEWVTATAYPTLKALEEALDAEEITHAEAIALCRVEHPDYPLEKSVEPIADPPEEKQDKETSMNMQHKLGQYIVAVQGIAKVVASEVWLKYNGKAGFVFGKSPCNCYRYPDGRVDWAVDNDLWTPFAGEKVWVGGKDDDTGEAVHGWAEMKEKNADGADVRYYVNPLPGGYWGEDYVGGPIGCRLDELHPEAFVQAPITKAAEAEYFYGVKDGMTRPPFGPFSDYGYMIDTDDNLFYYSPGYVWEKIIWEKISNQDRKPLIRKYSRPCSEYAAKHGGEDPPRPKHVRRIDEQTTQTGKSPAVETDEPQQEQAAERTCDMTDTTKFRKDPRCPKCVSIAHQERKWEGGAFACHCGMCGADYRMKGADEYSESMDLVPRTKAWVAKKGKWLAIKSLKTAGLLYSGATAAVYIAHNGYLECPMSVLEAVGVVNQYIGIILTA